ncbi:bifunctional ADP-dependent NAD(P)H-hydrate dehydratase/NAD(P)H-hydrate epimerase [Corynebacterium pygosceleis]|uniref:ADP-dependent (S)-NAD(P)H-hydrate dehydratase n=1 Tax=Corynebacterium pygosceleis TaxID=2800406 RepID=A0A9Q4C6Y6_9CORY|nr:bifunctional ADP-dependent NAD(P)H-hydrate dehydratase/NAD(P)H-hydrate epimerase [Corynebacterium pygosceleis]MCK7637570.1 bifunctional ADP-dependent NAD(P)H-hydrate dehydratase/NAD(P)H-hydrate epimerase [Corynebacterium pygosceleis]MCK7674761.1 bifunctional ADP-dependent NAD(P)H-hydrate dehydratase/NAD(P)H-hydrate epimerase [Corynebacterium pygosceleis]MCL0119650.1 bifunctional ADP-dependent NAD(P)H-hydrate dehydratase/NAD(P)H-hydrate epimerase [Corynebacterium pygosceleis]MCX7468101.1 bifu
MIPVHTPDTVRAAEKPLLTKLGGGLMRRAAHALAVDCDRILRGRRNPGPAGAKVLVLAGSGGNGGDALFAAAELARRGAGVTVWPVGSTLHGEASAFLGPRARWREPGEQPVGDVRDADLIIDGIVGIGASGGLRGHGADAARMIRGCDTGDTGTCPAVVAVDIPSGVDPMTGHAHDDHLPATHTVTFGALKPVHVFGAEHCGTVTCHGLGIDRELENHIPYARLVERGDLAAWPRPGRTSDKYTGGVVGIHAGSGRYPGAAVLATAGALRATSPMVRFAGSCHGAVTTAHPEVIGTATTGEAGRVQAWAVGPGTGTGDDEAGILADLLATDLPVLLDADALTLVSSRTDLADAVTDRGHRGAFTVLTPHDREFGRLAGTTPGPDRIAATRALAEKLNCCVLLKGRVTVIATTDECLLVDAGCSWAATPGSGDVLTGITGAAIAHRPDPGMVALAAKIHAEAALACGGPVPSGDIAEAVRGVVRKAVNPDR